MKLSLNRVTKYLRYGNHLRPERDWFMLLCVFLAAVTVSVAYNLLTFSQVLNGEQIGNESAATATDIKLDDVQALFESRSAERERYSREYRFVDPSL